MDMILKSGRKVYCNDRFALDENLHITYGYDGSIPWPPDDDDDEADRLTPDDMREIADLMLDRWTRFRASLAVS